MSLALGRLLFGRIGVGKWNTRRDQMERTDAYRTILLLNFRRLRLADPAADNATLIAQAKGIADASGAIFSKGGTLSSLLRRNRKSIPELRVALQEELRPQVREIFRTFRRADDMAGGTYGKGDATARHRTMRRVLEEARVSGDLEVSETTCAAVRKRLIVRGLAAEEGGNEEFTGMGYWPRTSTSVVEGAGRGLFIEGIAPMGSILAFLPGRVILNEHLGCPESFAQFREDPKYQLSLRHDGHVIDCRNCRAMTEDDPSSPYFHNPWALGHMANHPPARSPRPDRPDGANAIALPVDYMSGPGKCIDENEDDPFLPVRMRQYIPNVYAKKPTTVFGLSMDVLGGSGHVEMHGMCLLASRDIKDEEVYYDYRLPEKPDNWPDWYMPIAQPDGEEWEHDNKVRKP